jgi:hypothetical protein
MLAGRREAAFDVSAVIELAMNSRCSGLSSTHFRNLLIVRHGSWPASLAGRGCINLIFDHLEMLRVSSLSVQKIARLY